MLLEIVQNMCYNNIKVTSKYLIYELQSMKSFI